MTTGGRGIPFIHFLSPSLAIRKLNRDRKPSAVSSDESIHEAPAHFAQSAIDARDNEVFSKQQSLFNEIQKNEQSSMAKSQKPILTNQSAEESVNPFLPDHIRKRLSSNSAAPSYKKSFVSPTRKNTLTEDQFTKIKLPNANNQELIDSLVAEFMPLIEAKLRQILIERISQIDTKKQN